MSNSVTYLCLLRDKIHSQDTLTVTRKYLGFSLHDRVKQRQTTAAYMKEPININEHTVCV